MPDRVLFVNGIPLAVVEAESLDLLDPLTEALTQLLRYSNRRIDVDEPEGAEALFRYAQVLAATCFGTARVGTVGAAHEHYLEWRDTYPAPPADPEAPGGQQTTVAGLLRANHLLDAVRNFALFAQVGGQMVKIVPRYQQFRAVHKALDRLRQGQTRAEHGEAVQRGASSSIPRARARA